MRGRRPGGDLVSPPGLTRRLLAVALVLAPAVASAQSTPAPTPSGSAATSGQIDGAQLFATVCGWCHEGGGHKAGKGPKLAGTQQPDEYLVNRIKTGKVGAMPAFGRAFSDEQIRAIVAYIKSLKDEPQ